MAGEQTSLKRRVMNAGLWSIAGFFLNSAIRFGSNLVLARLLMPDMFGVMAVASTVLVGLHMFSDFGIKQNIIQSSRGRESLFLNTAWSIQISRGLVLFCAAFSVGLVILIAGRSGYVPFGTAYADASLPPVICVLSVSAIVAGFESTKIFEASRILALGRLTRLEIACQIIGLISTMTWLMFDRSIWALVSGGITSGLARTVLSHVWLPGTPNRRKWDPQAASEIIKFGRWIMISSILGFFVNAGDKLLLGGMIDARTLGQYVIASLFMASIEGILVKMMQDVSFPSFSEVVRNRPLELKKHYYKFHLVIAATAYFSAGSLMICGRDLIAFLYDQRYSTSGWMLEILSVILITVPFRLATQSFLALGAPKLLSKIIVLRLAAMMILVPGGFYLAGVQGAVGAIVLSHFSYIPTIVYYNSMYKLLDVRREFLVSIFIPLGLAFGFLLSRGLMFFGGTLHVQYP
ncbi:oligosaccharide flippase family protein [Bradyrhizobium lablabi]|uniref:oligosaccharide flippase family protein n=1 Tax=Bradyrhizobium lablabi TaxID=722472 RepID=UPI00090C00AE|nr:oligosaccharide flippase family protein [Bradyrhizobium lablabi]SHK60112.1 Membrane protein involved in the export of O-antigen and teichoic acid [Bradyrhizobium lablabi]